MIREYQSKDLDQIMQIWLEANEQAHPFINPEFFRQNYDLVKTLLPLSTIYVQDLNGVKGFIGLTDNYIAGLFVAKDSQHQGIGKALLNKAQQLHPVLVTNVYKQNENAVKFYQRNGFEIISESLNEETHQPEFTMQSNSQRSIRIGKCAL
ncbi:N-acetyltransferase [Orbaceae bacterium ac157xtp]